jgi:hypothetical protein
MFYCAAGNLLKRRGRTSCIGTLSFSYVFMGASTPEIWGTNDQ